MATNAENMATALAGITAEIAEVFTNPKPNYTIDGVSVDRIGYYRFLVEQQKALQEQLARSAGPFEVYG